MRQRYRGENIPCVNFISSPGSGKTALLEKTLAALPQGTSVAVLTPEIQTDNDARRLSRYCFPRVRSGLAEPATSTCMVDRHLNKLGFHGPGLLLIENVGSLVCPSSYDLGKPRKSSSSALLKANTSLRSIREFFTAPP